MDVVVVLVEDVVDDVDDVDVLVLLVVDTLVTTPRKVPVDSPS